MSQYLSSSWILISLLFTSSVLAGSDINSRLKGNYAFTGTYSCIDASNGGFNPDGTPVSPANSLKANIVITGVMSFDGKGNTTQSGKFVEVIIPASTTNTSAVPSVHYGSFTADPSPYSISTDGAVTVTLGSAKVIGLGADAGLTIDIASITAELSGQLSRNGTLLLTTSVPLHQTLAVSIGDLHLPVFPRMCSLTMTLVP